MIKKKIAIICFLDGFANSVRPKEIKKFLEKRGHHVELINTTKLYSLEKQSLPYRIKATLFIIGVISRFFGLMALLNELHANPFSKRFKATILIQQMKLRGRYLSRYLNATGFNVILCESSFDAYVVTLPFNGITMYDSPSPWGYELFYSNKFSDSGFEKFRMFEKYIYRKADYLNFHWKTYADFVKKNFYNGSNFITMNYGINAKQKKHHARFAMPLKIVFLGYLEGHWVNLPLLSKLSKIYPIDVYGGPKPDDKWGLAYKGYAPSLDILADYQLGLVTITDDNLRKSSFSSKHLDYLSYGLPVLSPQWRTDDLLDDVTISYTEKTFLQKIKAYEKKHRWNKMHKKSIKKTHAFSWEKTLAPLLKIVASEK